MATGKMCMAVDNYIFLLKIKIILQYQLYRDVNVMIFSNFELRKKK